MSDYALRGTFYLGEGTRDALRGQVDHIMTHLLEVEPRPSRERSS